MSVLWERLAGDTGRFAVKLAFHSDPDDGLGIDPDTAASWGGLQLWIDGINVCTHVDQGETLQAAHWYMLPLLEWLVDNWDPLLHEERLPPATAGFETAAELSTGTHYSILTRPEDSNSLHADERRYAWQLRHALRSARDGGILPDVHLRRLRDRIEVSWANGVLAGAADIDFLSPSGRSYQDPAMVGSALFTVVAEGANWLRDQVSSSPRLDALVASVGRLEASERNEERLAWLAGLGGARDQMIKRWRGLRDAVKSWADKEQLQGAFESSFLTADTTSLLVLTGSCEAALLFGSTSPTITEDDAIALARILLTSYSQSPPDRMSQFVEEEPADASVQAWEQGYELALALLDDLDEAGIVQGGDAIDVERLLVELDVDLTDVTLSDRLTRAVSFASPTHKATVALNTSSSFFQSSTARRFTLAHELCHLLYDREQGIRLAVASGPWAPRVVEQRANAFAAMLLMPPSRIAAVVEKSSADMTTIKGIRRVASALKVSGSALIEHAHNLGLIDDAVHEELRQELTSAVDEPA